MKRQIRKSNATYPGLPTSTTGAIGELRVSADLMIKGYEVFRALSPACPCDLLVSKNGKILRIEVRTGQRRQNGQVVFPGKTTDIGKSDCFAVVLPNEIVYIPELK